MLIGINQQIDKLEFIEFPVIANQSADWFGMTVLFDAQSFLHKFRFVAPQNDTERVWVKTITDHVRHDLAARPAGKFQFFRTTERYRAGQVGNDYGPRPSRLGRPPCGQIPICLSAMLSRKLLSLYLHFLPPSTKNQAAAHAAALALFFCPDIQVIVNDPGFGIFNVDL
ncbi:MAG: hypothetical protein MSS94_05820, partial [Clostridiales bacterium]|nr:hypothetical protein [Clostridiales bacterium]